jgi:transcriptional regulator with XRE-family HTH domain
MSIGGREAQPSRALSGIVSIELRGLGEVVRRERVQRQLSQEGLAALAGLSRTQIGEIERGTTNISFTSLIALADGLQLSLSELIRRYEDDLLARKR